ncbi:MAG: hypothetical protein GX025_10825 [Clostridiales bacterium]|nr:hypothetical protein [Clostridiales bacterium]
MGTTLDPKINAEVTKAEADSLARKSAAKATKEQKETHAKILKQRQVEVSLAPMYQPWFGRVMTVSLNGSTIFLPVDGRGYKVPEAFAALIHERRRAVDDQVTRSKVIGNVQENRETAPGELELVPR